MDQIKISQLTERTDIEGVEMIPIQIGDLNYKVSVDTIVQRSKEILHAYQQYTYDELKQLKDSKLLIPGEHYLLTDYQCIYKQPVSEEVITCGYDGWLIMLLATSEYTFSNDAHIFFTEDSTYITNGGIPIVECNYVFDNFENYKWSDATSKGIIIDLTDSNNNRCNYDFKHIKFRRWALKDVTENDTVGAAGQPSCYRCYGTEEEPKRSDGRTWVGSGLEIEKEYIKSIFAGTFNSVMWGQDAVHEDYITKAHKPFKLTDDRLQYVAYNTDLSSLSDLTASVPGLVKFEIDTNDYIDCYTFDHNGVDLSNIVVNNTIGRCNNKALPNVVILVQSSVTPASNIAFDNDIHAFDCTIALHKLANSGLPQMNQCKFEETRYSIFNVFRLAYTKLLKQCISNYVSGTLRDCSFEDLQHSVLFGYFTAVSALSCTYNLLFGNEHQICKLDGTWESPADGNYWYNDIIQEWFGYNIMAPFQYSVFYPHTNTNFVKMPYNKGVTLMGTFQDNFIERMRWGTVVQYGAVQGNHMGEIVGTVISPSAFKSQVAHSSGESAIYTLEGATQLTSIMNTDVKGYQMDTKSLQNNLTDAQKTRLKERSRRKILFVENSIPYVKYYSELITGEGGTITQYNTITVSLEGCKLSYVVDKIVNGDSYNTNVIPNEGYSLNNATIHITMDGVDVTSSVYSNGTITISEVTGNVIISIKCVKVQFYTITRNLTGCTSNSNIVNINEGDTHTEIISPNSNYTLDGASVLITMGGIDVSSVYSGGVLNISKVTGNLVINIEAVYIPSEQLILDESRLNETILS